VKLHWRFVLYVVGVNAAAALVAVPFLLANRIWVLAAEVAFALSLLVGLRLVRRLFRTLETIQDGAQFLQDGDFTSRLRETAQPELDQLVRVYNQMVDHLRDERARLQEQHHFLAQILEQSPSAIVVLDFDGAIALCNPTARRLLDLGADSGRGRRLSAFPPEAAVAHTLATLAAGETRVVPLPDGRRLKCRRGAFLDRGFSRGFFLIEELTEELRQAEKAAYEKLIRMMSHEVNNSVGATGSLLHSCLTYRPLLPEEQGRDLETALRVVISRTEQLGSLMRSFADVVRLPPPQLRPTDPEELLARVAVLLRAECERRRVAWTRVLEAPPGPIALDPVQMEQVFVNIAKNALEAIGQDGTVTVRLGRRGERPFVAIEDTGPGIPPEARAHLFTPFFTTKETGQGIGLMLIQQILDQHHFDYTLDSPPGGPTRFTVLFPAPEPYGTTKLPTPM
jgi:two-component system, NtrC family, nitrogen regulation sensor histidine kinase NtrY